MSFLKKIIPGFRGSCLMVGILNISFFLLTLSQGIMNTMAEFKVPESLLNSPHYSDSMFWVFLHMAMIGVLIILIGIGVEKPGKQRWISGILVVIFCVYLFLDIRGSDNKLGTGLYQGPRSLFPVFVDILYVILFLRLTFFGGKILKKE